MARRAARNRTNIPRIEGIPVHEAWISFVCVRCQALNRLRLGSSLLDPKRTYETAQWRCEHCGFAHSRQVGLPFPHWPESAIAAGSITTDRFWKAFFQTATERQDSYWKQCNACGRILAFGAFSRHSNWGPLERQMECRACKAAINAMLNPKRTKEQLHEAAFRRRVGDMLLEGRHERISHRQLFKRFGGRCFKTRKVLHIKNRSGWAIDHILPSRYLYPLTRRNAALLSKEMNEVKRDRWPGEFYTNSELVRLARITGADLSVLTSPVPILNDRIDVDACVDRALRVRERSRLRKRIQNLRKFLKENNLVDRLSRKNRRMLGFA